MIGRIVIENYKSVENLSLDLGRVTILIGANGSGKSNILEAIALCSAAAANKLDNEFLFSRGIRVPDDPHHMKSAFDKSSSIKSVNIKILKEGLTDEEYADETKSVAYWASLDISDEPYAKWEDDVYSLLVNLRVQEAISFLKHKNTSVNISDDFMEDVKNLYERQLYRRMTNFGASNGLVDFVIYCPENSVLRSFANEGQIQPLGIRGEGLFKLLTILARPENRERLDEIQGKLQLLDWFGGFEIGDNVGLGERTLKIRDEYLDASLAYISQRSANEGFLFLLFYFTLFIAEQTPRFFAIDNIDASLNPKLCAELVRQLAELAEKHNKQVILTTHNPAVLDGLNLHDETQKLYVVERDLEGRTQARAVLPPRPPEKHEETVPLSEAFLRGYIGGLPKNF